MIFQKDLEECIVIDKLHTWKGYLQGGKNLTIKKSEVCAHMLLRALDVLARLTLGPGLVILFFPLSFFLSPSLPNSSLFPFTLSLYPKPTAM